MRMTRPIFCEMVRGSRPYRAMHCPLINGDLRANSPNNSSAALGIKQRTCIVGRLNSTTFISRKCYTS